MEISQEGVTLIKHYEGCPKDTDGNAVSYRCPANKPTIGYGSLKLKDGTPVEDNMTITMEEAEDLLAHELKEYEGYIHDLVKVELNQMLPFGDPYVQENLAVILDRKIPKKFITYRGTTMKKEWFEKFQVDK